MKNTIFFKRKSLVYTFINQNKKSFIVDELTKRLINNFINCFRHNEIKELCIDELDDKTSFFRLDIVKKLRTNNEHQSYSLGFNFLTFGKTIKDEKNLEKDAFLLPLYKNFTIYGDGEELYSELFINQVECITFDENPLNIFCKRGFYFVGFKADKNEELLGNLLFKRLEILSKK